MVKYRLIKCAIDSGTIFMHTFTLQSSLFLCWRHVRHCLGFWLVWRGSRGSDFYSTGLSKAEESEGGTCQPLLSVIMLSKV